MSDKIIDTEKAKELVEHLNNMSNEEVHNAFCSLNYDGLVNLNLIMAHAIYDVTEDAKQQIKKDKH